ncbi:s-adenosyl-l-methionine-dependent methyltransferase [Desulfoluna butyratoxydans]|uniref:protein-glutamate O-methyltransferase n=2 Tax=Desulfoluna butyratoxydans TaxID=231438 RepID=A0A4U8YN72_9BACT|nr:s-adenosyl-l-methionine-dependent methyltransferase [Desulfoluna butyratoxydans]
MNLTRDRLPGTDRGEEPPMASKRRRASFHPHLSTRDFRVLARFIHGRFGIKVPDVKKGMIEARLCKRLSRLDMGSYAQYCDYLFSPEGMEKELSHFIDEVTTNKTDFFREANHFTCLVDEVLPAIMGSRRVGAGHKLKVWSCACSRGDEPYTLAMVLSEFARSNPGFDFSILATDISTRVLEVARRGVYDASEIAPVPLALRKKYLLKSKDPRRHQVRIVPGLRKKVMFRQLNLMDSEYRLDRAMDIIFCRNVTIYFDTETTQQLMLRLCDRLAPGGHLFMGHSEFLDCKMLPLVPVAPTVYKKVRTHEKEGTGSGC